MARASYTASHADPDAPALHPHISGAGRHAPSLRSGIEPMIEPWPRQLDRKLDRYLTGYSTATQQDSSTATRQFLTDLDRPRQNPPDCMRRGVKRCQARQLDRPRQTNDRLTTDLDRAEPIRTSLFECLCHFGAKRSGWHGGAIHERYCSFGRFVRSCSF